MEVGSFKEWLLLREMAHKHLAVEADAPGDDGEPVTIDSIDFRFEDYPKATDTDRAFVTQLMNTNNFWRDTPPFFGKFPGSYRFIAWDGNKLEILIHKPMAGSESSGGYVELPARFDSDPIHNWWDYAAGMNGNEIVKKPLRMRLQDNN